MSASFAASLPPSLWAATAPPGVDAPPLAEAVATDVAIVGAGYTGLVDRPAPGRAQWHRACAWSTRTNPAGAPRAATAGR